MAWVQIHEEVREHERSSEWTLCFQFCTYHLDDGPRDGYRFIWRTPEGHLQPARGQARIEDRATLEKLLGNGRNQGMVLDNNKRTVFRQMLLPVSGPRGVRIYETKTLPSIC